MNVLNRFSDEGIVNLDQGRLVRSTRSVIALPVLRHILLLALMVSGGLSGAESQAQSQHADKSAGIILKALGGWHRGPVYASAVSGDHVYFSSGGSIRVLTFEPSASFWREVASIDTTGVVRDL